MSKPSNILLITTDQQRFDTIAAAGYDHMITPNLDKLATMGTLFTRAYSPNPVCIPARHNLLCGVGCRYHTFDDNYFDDSHTVPYDLPTFPRLLADAGYDTMAIGKMHFQPARNHNGFNHLQAMDELPRYLEDDEYAMYLKKEGYGHIQSIHGVRHLLYMQPQQSLVDEAHHGSTWVADRTIEYLKNHCQDRPFMLWAGFIAPHPPFDVPSSYAHLYDDVTIPFPIESKTSISTLAKENANMGDHANMEVLMRAKRAYYASISFVDHQIGRILDALVQTNQLEDTLIVFTSDHGEMMGDMGTYQKFLPYEGSAHIPMILYHPDHFHGGTINDELVSLNDLFPTFLDIAHIPYPNHELYGHSLIHSGLTNDHLFIEHNHGAKRWISCVSKRFKYNYYYGGGREELFDLTIDPYETTNLLETDPDGHITIKDQLKAQLILDENHYGLPGYIENGDFKVFPDFEPIFYRECNPPFIPNHLSESDRHQLNALEDEIHQAIQDEPLVVLDQLDVDYFEKRNVISRKKLFDQRKDG